MACRAFLKMCYDIALQGSLDNCQHKKSRGNSSNDHIYTGINIPTHASALLYYGSNGSNSLHTISTPRGCRYHGNHVTGSTKNLPLNVHG